MTAVAVALLTGLAGSVQIAVMGRLGSGLGVLEALAIDRFGLFGVNKIAISWPRALGIGLLGIGAVLSLVR